MEISEYQYQQLADQFYKRQKMLMTARMVIEDRDRQNNIIQNAMNQSKSLLRMLEAESRKNGANVNKILAGMEFVNAITSLRLLVQDLQSSILEKDNCIDGLMQSKESLQIKLEEMHAAHKEEMDGILLNLEYLSTAWEDREKYPTYSDWQRSFSEPKTLKSCQ